MTNIERRNKNMLYITNDEVMHEQSMARRLTQKLNTMDRADFAGIRKVAAELFGRDDVNINPPFYCDYGWNIHVGKNFICNYNCTVLDVGKVTIGDNCMIGPNVSIYAAGHPLHPAARNTQYEFGADITIGDNVWIGGNTVICPGVTIGDNTVIGAASVVTRDIPEWSLAAGNPCRVLREITEDDRYFYYHQIPVDDDAKNEMERMWREAQDEKKYPD